MCASASGRRSFVCPTSRCPSAVAVGPATTSLQRPVARPSTTAKGELLPRLVPELLDRGGEEVEQIDARSLGDALELLDEPGQPGLGEREVLAGQPTLVVDRAAGGDRRGVRRLGVDAVAGGFPEQAPDFEVVRSGDADDLDTRRRHDVSSSRRDPNAPTYAATSASVAGTEQVGPAPTIASQTPRFAR